MGLNPACPIVFGLMSCPWMEEGSGGPSVMSAPRVPTDRSRQMESNARWVQSDWGAIEFVAFRKFERLHEDNPALSLSSADDQIASRVSMWTVNYLSRAIKRTLRLSLWLQLQTLAIKQHRSFATKPINKRRYSIDLAKGDTFTATNWNVAAPVISVLICKNAYQFKETLFAF